MWLQRLIELQQATEEIIKDETVGYLELIKMRDDIKQLHSLLQHHIEQRLMKDSDDEEEIK